MKESGSVVIYGGSFNPPLNSHFAIAEQVLNQCKEVEKIIFIPVNSKYNKKGLIENKHRYEMLKRVVEKNDGFAVSDIDMKGERSLATIETIEIIQEQLKNKRIYFLIGSDNLKEIDTWKRAEELVSSYKILVMEREGDKIENIIKENRLLKNCKTDIEKINPEIKSNFNSTYVRNQIKEGKSVRYLMPDEVYEYIEKNKLYRG